MLSDGIGSIRAGSQRGPDSGADVASHVDSLRVFDAVLARQSDHRAATVAVDDRSGNDCSRGPLLWLRAIETHSRSVPWPLPLRQAENRSGDSQ